MYVVDTNILLEYPQFLENERGHIIIGYGVLSELDNLKNSLNPETAFQARRAATLLFREKNNIKFNEHIQKSIDDSLIEIAQKEKAIIVSNDIYLLIKAEVVGVEAYGWTNPLYYNGIEYFYVNPEDKNYYTILNNIITTLVPPKDVYLKENQYFVIKNKTTDEVISRFVYRNGKLEDFKKHIIFNHWITKVSPRNIEQECLIEALFNEKISIVYAGGGFGKGKTYLMNNFALQELEKGRINKIIYVPNNSFVENSMEIGYLPGDMFSKLVGQIGPIIDLIGIDELQHLISRELIEIVPIGSMRGRNFENSIILVSEAQNLDTAQIKLLIGRVGNNSRIFFDGSLTQIDNQIFKNKNGLKLLLNIANHPEFCKNFATVELQKVERSKTAQIADYLDEIG